MEFNVFILQLQKLFNEHLYYAIIGSTACAHFLLIILAFLSGRATTQLPIIALSRPNSPVPFVIAPTSAHSLNTSATTTHTKFNTLTPQKKHAVRTSTSCQQAQPKSTKNNSPQKNAAHTTAIKSLAPKVQQKKPAPALSKAQKAGTQKPKPLPKKNSTLKQKAKAPAPVVSKLIEQKKVIQAPTEKAKTDTKAPTKTKPIQTPTPPATLNKPTQIQTKVAVPATPIPEAATKIPAPTVKPAPMPTAAAKTPPNQ